MNKHRNVRCTVGGIKFDSKGEAGRYTELLLLERAGKISGLQRQTPFILAQPVKIDGKMKRALVYRADFTYIESGQYVVEDFKGHITPVFRIKQHLMAERGYTIRLVRA